MKIFKVLIFILLGTILGAFLFALIANKMLSVPVKEEADNIANLAVTAYGFAVGGIIGSCVGFVLGLLRVSKSNSA